MPVDDSKVDGTAAVSCPLETKLVASTVVPFATAEDELTKLVPVSVIVTAGDPAASTAGETPLREGAGLLWFTREVPPEAPLPHPANARQKISEAYVRIDLWYGRMGKPLQLSQKVVLS